jgi:hypothetical protein
MTEHSISLEYDPNRLLDTLMKRLEVDTDEALSRTLQVSADSIGDIRAGRVAVSASMLLWFSDLTELSTDELRRIMGDRRAKARMTCYLSSS